MPDPHVIGDRVPTGHVVPAVVTDTGFVRPRQPGDILEPMVAPDVPDFQTHMHATPAMHRAAAKAAAGPFVDVEQIEGARGDQPVHLARARLVDRIIALATVIDRLDIRARPVLTPPPPGDPVDPDGPSPQVSDLAHNLDSDSTELGRLVARLDRIVDRLEV